MSDVPPPKFPAEFTLIDSEKNARAKIADMLKKGGHDPAKQLPDKIKIDSRAEKYVDIPPTDPANTSGSRKRKRR